MFAYPWAAMGAAVLEYAEHSVPTHAFAGGIDARALIASVTVARVPELSVRFTMQPGKVRGVISIVISECTLRDAPTTF